MHHVPISYSEVLEQTLSSKCSTKVAAMGQLRTTQHDVLHNLTERTTHLSPSREGVSNNFPTITTLCCIMSPCLLVCSLTCTHQSPVVARQVNCCLKIQPIHLQGVWLGGGGLSQRCLHINLKWLTWKTCNYCGNISANAYSLNNKAPHFHMRIM